MFFVELKEANVEDEDDEINKSIKEIHQSAQKLSDNIEKLSHDHEKFVNKENMLSFSPVIPSNDDREANDAITGETSEDAVDPIRFECKVRSSTLKSNFTDDFDTPPETPEFIPGSGSTSLNSTLSRSNFEINNGDLEAVDSSPERINCEDGTNGKHSSLTMIRYQDNSSDDNSNDETPPKPPPRPKRKSRMKIKNLSLDERGASQDYPHQNDILFRTDSALQLRKENNFLKGNISVLIISAGGLRQQWKPRWGVYDKSQCKLRFYKNNFEEDVIGETDVLSATFTYDLENDQNGQFKICTKDEEQTIDVGNAENRLYWLQQLQKARREFTQTTSSHHNLSARTSVGLLKEKAPDESSKESSPFKDIFATMERPPEISTPRSADFYGKKSFFQNFTRKASFKLVRSSSDRTPSPTSMEPRSPPPSKPFASPTHSQGFQALSKIRKSLREKRPPLGPRKATFEDVSRELETVKDDLQASQDDASASKEVISVLRKQIQKLQKEKETLSAMKPELAEGQLIDILREKDEQIVELESSLRERDKEKENLDEKMSKLDQDAAAYLQLIEVKDQSIVRLSNQLHELELSAKIDQASPPVNGTFFYAEKVTVGTQSDVDKEKETLQDTVTAFLMQNKFLNKEVLELNQLRQQAIDREQKLFIEASDWEAKFYQIQSKYLLLLNELHNPQVMVSASRQEMVGHLLKDIVESSEKPSLSSQNPKYDRFGFKIDEDGSLEEKAERLRRLTQENLEETELSLEEVESRWDSVVSTLSKPVHFTVTLDMKNLIRRGIPINLKGTVWKAIVDNRIRGSMERPQPDYYQALLSNYNPGLTLSPAAKQIELDLLRTLPSNKHYDSPHASGIPKLRRVLLAYSLHNPEIEYCQGFNRIAAIALLFLNEEDAFWCLVYIVEVVMPQSYYSKQLIGAQIDQAVFKELVTEKLPSLATHLENHGVDPALFSLNWFLCLFVDTLPVATYLHIWDSLLFEGSKVLFRYALAILKSLEEKLLRQNDYMSIFSTFRTEVESLSDIKKLTQIAFHDLNPFPLRTINNKRETHQKILKAQMESLEVIRRDYRKNSFASKAPSPCYVQSDEDEGV